MKSHKNGLITIGSVKEFDGKFKWEIEVMNAGGNLKEKINEHSGFNNLHEAHQSLENYWNYIINKYYCDDF